MSERKPQTESERREMKRRERKRENGVCVCKKTERDRERQRETEREREKRVHPSVADMTVRASERGKLCEWLVVFVDVCQFVCVCFVAVIAIDIGIDRT